METKIELKRKWRERRMLRRSYNKEQEEYEAEKRLMPAALAVAIPALLALVLMLVFMAKSCHAAEVQKERIYSTVEVCDAIYRADGGAHAKYLYGIRSAKYVGVAEAHEICMRTVRQARRDYLKRKIDEGFIEFLSRRYCPIGSQNDPNGLNKYWVKNVKWFIKQRNN